jgi:hypothetical protein
LARRNGQTGVFLADEETLRARFVPVTVALSTVRWLKSGSAAGGPRRDLGTAFAGRWAAIRIPEVEAPAAEAGAKRPGVALREGKDADEPRPRRHPSPVFTTMVTLMVVILGLVALQRVPLDLMPDVTYPA